MNINFTPISMFDNYSLSVSGDNVIIDGQIYALPDLAAIVAAEQPPPKFVVSATGNSVILLLPYWGEAGDSVMFPAPLIDVPDGPVELPQLLPGL